MRIRNNLGVKIVAFFLAVVFLVGTVFFGACTAFAGMLGCYTGEFREIRAEMVDGMLREYAENVAKDYVYSIYGSKTVEKDESINYFFEIKTSDGVHIEPKSNMPKNLPSVTCTYEKLMDVSEHYTYIFYPGACEVWYEKDAVIPDSYPDSFSVTVYEKAAKPVTDWFALAEFWMDAVNEMRTLSIVLVSVSFVLLILVWIFLFCSAGYRKKSAEPSLGIADRIPFDLFTAICTAAFIAVGALCFHLTELVMYNHFGENSAEITAIFAAGTGIVLCVIALYLVVLGFLLSVATRLKVGGILRRTLIYTVLAFVFRSVYRLFCAFPLVWKTSLILLLMSIIEIFFMLINIYEPDNLVLLWVVGKLVVIPLVIWAALMLRKLKKGGEAIAAGRIGEKIDTKYMPLDFGDFGETLNNIGNGLESAVDEKMKSERLKTELITNVSHDIKTPLTSIVNYVDLIKKEKVENEAVREYIDVLDRHSSRLKKLIEDLVEASKASTGNISVELEQCDVGVLLEQSLGEYEEKLAKSELIPIVSQLEEPLYIMADGRRLWRVFDNLLGNICKYAMPKTRVYVTLEHRDNNAVITFRNISRESLGISSDELFERFVRGDASRNTEGSGLGLSIARSLVELQGGSLDLYIDGDLFKAVVTFPITL